MTKRRNLLKGALSAPLLGLTPVASTIAKELDKDTKWDKEADVVVIGFGGAGGATAIAAHDAGASVLILEKLAVGGGNTAASAGGFIIPKDPEQAYVYLAKTFEYADSDMDSELVRAFCEEAVKTADYFKSLDPTIEIMVGGHANFPNLPYAENITKYRVKGKKTGGVNLFNKLNDLVKQRNIEVLYETPAIELIRRGNEVVGVVANSPKGKVNIKANKGVVLTTGGYEYDPESLRNYCLGTQVHGLGSPGNTGDGLRLAQSMGAKLWHMTSYSCPLGVKIPGKNALVMVNIMTPGFIWVNQDGRRFCNETGLDIHSDIYAVNGFDPVKHRYPAIPCYLIMDEKGRTAGPITHNNFGYIMVGEGYKWSKGCEKEIEAGIVKKADTVEDLAKLINVPPEELVKTVKTWNENISKGQEPEFGRLRDKPLSEKEVKAGMTARRLSNPLDKSPFYAITMYPALLNTQGGPRRDVRGNVVNSLGEPIPRLYAGGELGSIWGTIYQGSSNVAECLVYGRIIGRNVAKEKPWS